jgi:ParB/RepB/Spo0J family partition protein
MAAWDISEIKIGKRHRQDMGDISSLAQSITDIGLLHPVVIRPDGRLIAGERRIRAFEHLGKSKIPATVIDLERVVRGEYAENCERKDFTPSESVAIWRAILPLERAAAKERQMAAGKQRGRGIIASGNLPEPITGEARDKAAKATGRKRRTLEKAEAVVAAAEKDPETFGPMVEEMDRTDNVDGVFKRVKVIQERADYERRADKGATIADLEALAAEGKRFAVIYADPGWEFKVYSGKGKQRSAERYYDTSSLEAIKALPVKPLAADDCVLLLWAVMPELPGALEVIKAWGFEYKTVGFVWVKQNKDGEGWFTGKGYWTRANAELCLLATRGSPKRMDIGVPEVITLPVDELIRPLGAGRASNHRTYLFVGNFVPLRTPKPATSTRRAPDNVAFVRIKTYFSLGFSAYS